MVSVQTPPKKEYEKLIRRVSCGKPFESNGSNCVTIRADSFDRMFAVCDQAGDNKNCGSLDALLEAYWEPPAKLRCLHMLGLPHTKEIEERYRLKEEMRRTEHEMVDFMAGLFRMWMPSYAVIRDYGATEETWKAIELERSEMLNRPNIYTPPTPPM